MHITFSEQHQNLIQIGRGIIDHAKENTPASIAALAQARVALSRAVQKHVKAELAMVDRNSAAAADPRLAATMSKYHDELLAWQSLLMTCNGKWPLKAINENPRGFIRDYRPIQQALEERVRWEEEFFYPYVLSTGHLAQSSV
jgi:hypothetical protein